VAYAALSSRAIRVVNARTARPKLGLRLQHLRMLVAVRDLVGGSLQGATVGSRSLSFLPGVGRPQGRYAWDAGSAGSVTAVASALLPLLHVAVTGVETR
jgi:RNA 3'-terminal phosphate cyclase (ATP)